MMSPSCAAVKAALTVGYCEEGTVRVAADALSDKNAKPTAPANLPTPDQGCLFFTVLGSFIALLITFSGLLSFYARLSSTRGNAILL